MRKFEVGDRVKIVKAHPYWSAYIGVETTVTSELVMSDYGPWLVHELDLKVDNMIVSVPPDYIIPVYDGLEPSSWSECVWKPERLSCFLRVQAGDPR